VKKIGDVVKEKKESVRGRKKTGEDDDIEVHKNTRMMKTVSVIVIAGGNVASQQVASFVKLDLQRKVHVAPSQTMKTDGWKNPHPLGHLSPLFPLIFRLQPCHHHLPPGLFRRPSMGTHLMRTTWVHNLS
jgi:hypothetical protein